MADVSAGSVSYKFKADVSDFKSGMSQVQQGLRDAAQQASSAGAQISKNLNQASVANDNLAKATGKASAEFKQMADRVANTAFEVTTFTGQHVELAKNAIVGLTSVVGVAGLAITALGAAMLAIPYLVIRKWSDEYQHLEQTSKITTVAIGDLVRMQQIANKTLDGFDVSNGLKEFAKGLREAQVAGGDLADLLKKNNIAISDSAGKARPLKDVFTDIAQLIARANNEVDKLKFAEKVRLGADAVQFAEKYVEELRKGNLALSEGEQRLLVYKQKASEFDKAWSEVWSRFVTTTKSYLLDGFTAVLDFAGKTYDTIKGAYYKVISTTHELEATLVGLFEGMGKAVTAAWENVPAAFEFIGKSIYNAFISALQETINAAIRLINSIADAVHAIASQIAAAWQAVINTVMTFIENAVMVIGQFLARIPDLVIALATNVAQLFHQLLQAVSDIWANLPTILENFARIAVNKLIEIVQGGINIMVGAFNQVLSLFSGGHLKEINLDGAKLQLSNDAQDIGKKITESFTNGLNAGRGRVQAKYKEVLSPTNAVNPDSINENARKTINGLYDNDKGGGKSKSPSSKEGLDAVQKYIEGLKGATEQARAEVELFGKSNEEKTIATNLIKAETIAKKQGLEITDQERQQIIDQSKEYSKQKALLGQLNDLKAAAKSLADSFTNALDAWIVRGEKFNQVIAKLLQQLSSQLLQSVLSGGGPFAGVLGTKGSGGIFGSLFGGLFGSGSGGGASILGSLFSGFFATGGNVLGGRGYVVGEKGPELFIPGADGAIVNNENFTGKGGNVINFHVTAPNPGAFVQSESQISALLVRAVKRGSRNT